MQLPNKAEFRLSTLQEVTLQPNEDGGKAVLVISSPMTPKLAHAIRRKEMLYDEKGLSREFTGSIGLSSDAIVNYQAVIKSDQMGDTIYSPEKIRGFKVVRGSEDSDKSDVQLRIEFRLHLTGKRDIDSAYALFMSQNKDVFDLYLTSKQLELFDGDAAEKPAPTSRPAKGRQRKAGAIASKGEMETASVQ